MRTKTNVDLSKLKKVITSKFEIITVVCKLYNGKNYVPMITSTYDGIHMKGSKHYTHEAIDLRKWDMTRPIATTKALKHVLGKDYDVILKETHIHIEYDKKK